MDVLADPSVQNVLLGVTANALTSLFATTGRRARKLLAIPSEAENAAKLLKDAAAATSDTFQWSGPGKIEEVCLFLASPEVAAITRQVFASRLLGQRAHAHLSEIELEFTTSLGLFLGQPNLGENGKALFHELLQTCERFMTSAAERG